MGQEFLSACEPVHTLNSHWNPSMTASNFCSRVTVVEKNACTPPFIRQMLQKMEIVDNWVDNWDLFGPLILKSGTDLNLSCFQTTGCPNYWTACLWVQDHQSWQSCFIIHIHTHHHHHRHHWRQKSLTLPCSVSYKLVPKVYSGYGPQLSLRKWITAALWLTWQPRVLRSLNLCLWNMK